MTVYELNKAGYASLPKMTKAEKESAKKEIVSFLESHDSDYYMMLNNDLRYYTLFTYHYTQDISKMAREMISVAESLGILKGIEINNDLIEFWITTPDNDCNLFLVFDYARGVIKV